MGVLYIRHTREYSDQAAFKNARCNMCSIIPDIYKLIRQ